MEANQKEATSITNDEADNPIIQLKLSNDNPGERLDKVLAKILSQYSRSRIQQWMAGGHVTIDGVVAQTRTTVYGDETVIIAPQASEDTSAFSPENIPLDIIFEDNDIIVINKPAGLVVHPAAGNWSGTMLNGLLHHHPALKGVPRAGIVHRLDKDTSGLLVVAKTLEAHTHLTIQLQERTVKREYLALVWGKPVIRGRIDGAISRHQRDRLKMAVSQSLRAKRALTHFERIETSKIDRHPVSLVRCRLETGRTHQIRVHMEHIGCPLVGDATYGKKHLSGFFPRQALHAKRLGLIHPESGEYLEWGSELPEDFAALLAQADIYDLDNMAEFDDFDEDDDFDDDFDDDDFDVEVIR